MALFKGDDGQIYQVIETEVVSRENLQQSVDDAQTVLEAAQKDLKAYDELAAQPPDEPTPPLDSGPDPTAPAEPAQPETPPTPATPADPTPPAEPPVDPITQPPTGDPVPPITIS